MSSHTHSVALSHNTTLTAASNQLQLHGQAQAREQPPAPGLQEATRTSTQVWQHDLEQLFHHAKERFPDVVWELGGDEDEDEDMAPDAGARVLEEVWGHKAIVYARAPPSFQNRYFSFRPAINSHNNQNHNNGGSSPYPAESSLSLGLPLPSGGLGLGHGLGLEGSVASFTSQPPRTPSPFRASSPSTTLAHSHITPGSGSGSTTLLRLTTSISPALFSDELEYLYTGKGFGEAFEFLFDSSEGREHLLGDGTHADDEDAEAQRVDKLRKDLVYMWRSRLYSDVRIALTGNFGGNHESTTAIFSSHRFILVSRSAYFADALSSWPTAAKHLSSASSSTPLPSSTSDPPTLTLPSPPFTPASLHFTLGFLYTGTLIFSHRSYDLSTAFTILKAALYLSIPSLHDEIQARIVQEMMHGLFHAFIPFAEYERLTGGRWGTGGCRCRQCARRAPRVLEFALEEDVRNQLLERGARRALVGLFGEGWCTQEFALLPPKIRESLLKGVGKRTTVTNVFPLLFAAEHALGRVAAVIEPWGDVVRDMLTSARRGMDELLARESEGCFGRGGSIASAAPEGEEGEEKQGREKEDEGREEWMEIMESDGVRFDDGEKVEWVMSAVLRGVKEPYAATLYQTLVSSILLRPHPQNPTTPLLPATSHVRVQVEQARLDLLKWIGGRWLGVRQAKGFDLLEGWALKEISDHIEVPIDDLLSPPAYSSSGPKTQGQGPSPRRHATSTGLGLAHGHLRPISNHPHTSKVDADSDVASSMRVSVLSRSLPMRGGSGASTSTAGSGREHHQRREREREADAHSVRSARSGLSYASSSRESVNTVSTARHTHTRTHAHASNSTHSHSVHTARSTTTTTDGEEGQEVGTEAEAETDMSPAKRLASEVRAGRTHEMKDRPDSKLSPASPVLMRAGSPIGVGGRQPSIVEPPLDEDEEDEDREVVVADNRSANGDGDQDGDEAPMQEERDGEEEQRSETSSVYHTPPVRQKTLITRASLASIASRTSTRSSPSVRSKTPSASPSLHSGPGSKASKAKSPTPSTPTSTSTTRKSTLSLSTLSSVSSASVRSSQYSNAVSARPSSRGSTRSRLTSAGAASASKSGASPASRPVSRVSTRSISGGAGAGASRPVSTATEGTFRTASTGSTPGLSTPIVRSRRTSTTSTVSVSSVRTAGGRSATGSPVNERARKVSGASVSSVASTVGSVGVSGRTPKRAPPVPVPAVDPTKLSPVVGRSKSAKSPAGTPKSPVLQSSFSAGSVKAGVVGGASPSPASTPVLASTADKEKDKGKGVLVGALSRKFEAGMVPASVGEKKSTESVGARRGGDVGRKADADREKEREKETSPSSTLTVPPELPSKDVLGQEKEKEKENVVPPPTLSAPAPAPIASSTLAPSDDMDMDDEPFLNTASQMTIRPKTHARSEVLSGVSGGSGSSAGAGVGAGGGVSAGVGVDVGSGVGTNNEHKKTSSSASTSSVATLRRERRGSGDTLRTVSNKSSALSGSSGGSGSGAKEGAGSKEGKTLPPTPAQQQQQPKHTSPLALPPTTPAPSLAAPPQPKPAPSPAPAHPPRTIVSLVASNTPTGSTLEIGIPCIISSKRKRFKAYARYIGEVAGETGSWVGVEVPLPTSDSWGDGAGGGGGYGYGGGGGAYGGGAYGNGGERQVDERQWNDGSWGGIRYFEIGGGGSEWEYGGGVYGDDRASRRRRVDAGSIGGSMGGMGTVRGEKGSSLKRERDGDQLSIAEERMIKSKRMRSVSPAVSDMSGTESRGLFVRPGQVLYVVDAVGADL
ncbi:hypothetical protein GALMADRAFT_147723 [Galerina marginata CBS 339.88]|uniref:BTB domain-containing protein n=1 Tax=Galerina marginata (strain CBS 339.88) TaxID=685588 RepID=A0A067S741_GALM3|nr:hypothetical protein GALMADRAFT_147723 [Galerina marginata CBS 339.88]